MFKVHRQDQQILAQAFFDFVERFDILKPQID